MTGGESVRADRWLWSVRAYKTRPSATEACSAGHVRVNDRPAKPASPLRAGDVVVLRLPEAERVLVVVRLIEKRVAAPIAAECYLDRTPPRRELPAGAAAAGKAPARPAGAGRPTKKDRRSLERLRARGAGG